MSEHLKKLCRTCLCLSEEMFPLFNVDIMEMFTSIPLNNSDDFPDHICGLCLNEIQRAYIFKRKCEKSQKILHQIKEVTIKVKKLKKISNHNENKDCKFPYNIKVEPEEIINDYADLISKNIANEIEIDNVDHTAWELQTNFKSEPELVIEDFSIRLINCDSNETEQDRKQFNCPACGRESQSLVVFLDHIVSDHIEGNLCKICNADFNCSKFEHSAKHSPSNYSNELFHDLTSTYFNRFNRKELSDLGEERKGEETVCRQIIIGEKCINEELIDEKFTDHTSEKSDELVSGKPKIQCKICLKILPRKLNLRAHMLIHTSGKSFECELCLEKIRQKNLLRVHKETKHTNELPDIKPKNQCHVRSKMLSYDGDLKRHILNHRGKKPLKCNLCFIKFANKKSLKEHFRTKHENTPVSFKSKNKCGVCSITFTRNSYLRIHMRLHEGETKFQCEFCSKQFQYKKLLRIHNATKHSDKLSDGKPRYQCYVCSKIFSYNNYLTSHMRTHKVDKPFECKLCSEKFWYSSLLMLHMKTKHTEELPGDEPMYNCTDCSKIFDSNELLFKHMIEHTDKKLIQTELCSEKFQLLKTKKTKIRTKSAFFKSNYQCGNCSIIFFNNKNLIMHMRSHSSEKPFQCELCLETFNQNSFFCHMQTKHSGQLTGVKPKYQCNICSKIFGYSKDLNRHMFSHTGEKPFQCEICSEKFGYKQSLVRHLKSRHQIEMTLPKPGLVIQNPTSESKYECKICSIICLRQNDLNTHMRTHIQKFSFKCDLCLGKFKKKESLACHMKLRHSEQSPEDRPNNKCYICSKIFDCSNDLMRHMRRHTEPRYKCKLCSEETKCNESLVRHMRNKHEKEFTDAKLKYQCNYCSQAFFHNKDLKSHMLDHRAVAMFECKLCSTKLVHKKSFLRHMKTQHPAEALAPEQNYHCDVCSRRFSRQDNLLRHMRIHSANTLFACNLCPRRFQLERSLNFHMKVKHPDAPLPDQKLPKHQCNVCLKILLSNGDLETHMGSHTGEKPYQFEICSRKELQIHTSLRHMEVKHDAKDRKPHYKCNVCSKSYVQYNPFIVHVNNHKCANSVLDELNDQPLS